MGNDPLKGEFASSSYETTTTTATAALVPRKRPKLVETRRRRVTFKADSMLVTPILGCQPFEASLSDGECLQLYRSDIWYTVRYYYIIFSGVICQRRHGGCIGPLRFVKASHARVLFSCL